MIKQIVCTSFKVLIPLSLMLASCSDQPAQRGSQGQILPNPTGPSPAPQDSVGTLSEDEGSSAVYILDHVFGRVPTEVREPRITDNSLDDKIEQNGKQPIVFDGSNPLESSVAGVAFNMSYAEASDILSPPIVGGCGSSGDYYRENLCLLWTQDEPRRLRQAFILGGYLGSFEFPEPMGLQPPRAELSQFFNDELGLDLIVKTYNKLFNEDESYNCIESQACEAITYNQYINWIFPNITLIFSRDRKVFTSLLISQDVTASVGPLDVLLGEMKFENGPSVTLGQTWSEAKAILNPQSEPSAIVETATFRKDYVGMVLRTEREGVHEGAGAFHVSQVEPNGNEIVNDIVVYSNYNEPILINGKYVNIEVNTGQNGREYILATLSENRPEPANMLTVRMDQLARKIELQKTLLVQLQFLMNQELSSSFANSDQYIVSQRVFGLNARQAPNRRMSLQTNIYDTYTSRAVTSLISIGYNSGGMSFRTIASRNPFEGIVAESTRNPVDFSSPELAGFSLGQVVALKSIDRVKSEAFLEIDGQTTRVEIDLFASDKVSYLENEGVYTLQENIQIVSGLAGVKMALAPLHSINQETTEIQAEVIYLSSARNTLPIENICSAPEDSSFVPQFGMLQREFFDGMRERLQNRSWAACSPFVEPDADGDRESISVYFPNQNMGQKVFFTDRILSGVVKYKKPGAPVGGQ